MWRFDCISHPCVFVCARVCARTPLYTNTCAGHSQKLDPVLHRAASVEIRSRDSSSPCVEPPLFSSLLIGLIVALAVVTRAWNGLERRLFLFSVAEVGNWFLLFRDDS